MKTIIGGAITSMFMGGASIALVNPHPALSNIAAVMGIAVSIATVLMMIANARKLNREALKADLEMDIIYGRCKDCTDPENCVFKKQHQPPQCKWKDKQP